MITDTVQRWRSGRASYRPAGEPIRARDYEVAPIADDSTARSFVARHHYEHSYPAARLRVGLHRAGELVGVAVFSQPASQAALAAALPFASAGVELGRFVLLDDVPANGESWFLARAFELARERFDAIVSHSDPAQRRGARGELVFPGHIGTIYQATNATYCGLTPRRTRRVLADGTILSARGLSKLRRRERGWRYVVELLVAHGAPAPAGDWGEWVRAAVAATSRAERHPGSHRYVWALENGLRRQLPVPLPYPKMTPRGGSL
ncbi:MAG TPA: hypothetical protein VG734_26040 [Lacunisphaera sp.]|nr:hypothetical protein [Lacunisphaera sp.]